MDVKLVKKAINGDEQAFERLIHSESEKLYRTAFLYVRNKEDAQPPSRLSGHGERYPKSKREGDRGFHHR